MTGLVLRRVRTQLTVALGLVALLGAGAVGGHVVGLAAARERGILGCLDGVRTGVCDTDAYYSFASALTAYLIWLNIGVVALPVVAGGAVGAALFGGELERGTHLFALTQGASRLRWFGHGLAVAGLPVALAVAGQTALTSWWWRPFGGDVTGGIAPLRPDQFLTSGLVPVAYTVLAFSVAAAAGLLLRSASGALGVAATVHVVLLLVTTLGVPAHYLPPERIVTPLAGVDPAFPVLAGEVLVVGYGYVDEQGRALPPAPDGTVSCPGYETRDFQVCLKESGVAGTYTGYQPPSRYWPFQLIEGGLMLALATAALGVGLRGLRRRVH